MSNSTKTAKRSSLKESKTTSLTKPLSSAMSEHSSVKGTPTHIREWLMSSVGGSPANPSQWPEDRREQTTPEICSPKSSKSQRLFDLASSSWKMSQHSLIADTSPQSSPRFPKQGMMRDGCAWEQTMWEQDTAGKDSGFGVNWPTPTQDIADRKKKYAQGGTPLALAVKMMPPPNTMDHLPPRSPEAMKRMYEGQRKGRTAPSNLREWVNPEMWPTPARRDYKGQNSLGSMKKKLENGGRPHQGQLPNAVAMKGDVGSLCCEWVEWLMGWPVGWTDLEPLSELVWHSWHTEPDIPRVKREKVPKRPARLKALGNGQVPLACAVAWEILDNS